MNELIYEAYQELIERLHEFAEWADTNIFEVPITLPDTLRAAADVIGSLTENLNFR